MQKLVFVISSVISGIVLSFVARKKFDRPIVIKHNLNPCSWFRVHTLVYLLTLFLMLFSDKLYYSFIEITSMPLGISGIFCLFIQTGGGIIIVMILSSWIYDFYIKLIEFNYFIERHLWVKKVFFSIVCISLVVIYILEVSKRQQKVNVLDDDYRLIAMWIVVFIQIWVGFGMKVCIPKFRKLILFEKNNYINDKELYREENKYLTVCLISMFIVPIMLIGYFAVADILPKMLSDIISALYYGVLVGAFIVFLTLLICTVKHRPNKWWSIKRFNKLFVSLQENVKTEHFVSVKYELKKDEKGYVVTIFEENIKIDDVKTFPKEYMKRVSDVFGAQKFSYYFDDCNEKVIKESIRENLIKISDARQDMLKEGWDIVYKLFDEKERKKSITIQR